MPSSYPCLVRPGGCWPRGDVFEPQGPLCRALIGCRKSLRFNHLRIKPYGSIICREKLRKLLILMKAGEGLVGQWLPNWGTQESATAGGSRFARTPERLVRMTARQRASRENERRSYGRIGLDLYVLDDTARASEAARARRQRCAAVPLVDDLALAGLDGAGRLRRARSVDRSGAYLSLSYHRGQLRIWLGDRPPGLLAGQRPRIQLSLWRRHWTFGMEPADLSVDPVRWPSGCSAATRTRPRLRCWCSTASLPR